MRGMCDHFITIVGYIDVILMSKASYRGSGSIGEKQRRPSYERLTSSRRTRFQPKRQRRDTWRHPASPALRTLYDNRNSRTACHPP